MYLSAIISKALLLPIALAGVVAPRPPPAENSESDGAVMNDTVAAGPMMGPPPKTAVLAGNPTWCKYKHNYFDNWVAVYSRDWGYDDHMRGFLDNLRGDCWIEVQDWGCSRYGEHGAYATFTLPWISVSAPKTKQCVASAFRKASPPSRRQSIECCSIEDTACAARDMKRYFGRPEASQQASA